MYPRARRRRTITALRVWAVLVLLVGTGRLLAGFDDKTGAPTASPSMTAGGAVSTATPPVASVPEPLVELPPTVVAAPEPIAEPPSPSNAKGTSNVERPPAPPPTLPPLTPTPHCDSDVSLADSPDAPYSFQCSTSTGNPVVWPSDRIALFANGLTPVQSSALELALVEWQDKGHFTVTRVNDPAAAQIVMSQADLGSVAGRTHVDVWCATVCLYTHAAVRLSSTQLLTPAVWVTAILHELGHAAGLNHVSRTSEIMYPELSFTSPVLYGSGDRSGLAELADRRPT